MHNGTVFLSLQKKLVQRVFCIELRFVCVFVFDTCDFIRIQVGTLLMGLVCWWWLLFGWGHF